MDSDPDSSSIEYFDECFPSFDCKGQQNRTYLKSKHFFQCLHFQLHVQNKPLVTIFNKSFSSGSILWNDTEFLFGEIKKYFFLTRTLAIDKINLFQSEGPLIEVQKYRKCTVKAFQFLLNSLQHVTSEYCKVDARDSSITSNFPFSKLFFSILREIKNLLIFIGRISSASNLVHTMDLKETSLSAEYYYHYVHLYLDIWWHCITILLTLNHLPFRKEKLESFCNDVDQLDPFLQVISLILVDYIYIAIKNFSEVNSYCYHSPFLCKCFEDFWVMLIKVLDTKATDRKYSFWNIFHNAVQNLQKDSKNEKRVLNVPIDSFLLINEHMECKEIIEPCLWLISHIAPLYKIDAFGDYNEFENPKSGYEVVKYLVHSLLIDLSEKKEKSLRSSLFYILNLVTIWEPSCEILLPLVDFYIKKINEAFSVPGIEVKSLVYLFNSSMSWFQYINELSSTCTSLGNETSYDIFLRILCKQLIKDSNEGNLWRSLKGRMYSKFISKKILELSEIGLQNSFSLILAVATSGQLEVSDKICDLACIIKTSSSRKQLISWKALFVLMHIYQKKALKFNKIITKAVEFFNDACSEYSATRDSAHKANLMKLLVVYIDSMNELFEQSNDLKLSEYQLIGSGFSILLFSCGISELNYILRVFLNILIKVQCIAFEKHHANNVMYEQYIGLLELSFKHIFPFIEHISVTNTPPIYVSDIAAVLTILSQKFASTLTDRIAYNFCSIFLHFGTKDNVNSSIIRQYLCAVLDDEYLQSGIKEKILNFNSLIFQSWLKCIIDLFPSLKQMKCLTQKVIMQSDIADMFPKVKNIINNEIECENIATELFRIMGQTYDESTDLKHKHQLKLKMHDYFQKYVLIILTKVKKLQDNSTLSYVYKLTSCLVEYCSPLLYMKYNTQNILPQLFDNILVPAAVFPKDKHTQSILSNVIKDHMLGLIKGLFKLDYKNDKFVGRTLKDVMVNNMCIHLSSNNPIFKLCIDSIHNRKDGLKWDEFQFLLDVIKNYILNNSSNSIHAFEMIFEIFKSASLSKKQDISSILLKCTFETYMKQSISLSDYLRNLMCKIFMYFKDNMDLNDSKKILIPILQWFIQEKIPWSSARGFSVLDCFLEYLPQILSEIIPFLTKTVEELENSRGFGVDVTLRNHLKSTIAKLQEKLSVNHRKT